MLGSTGAFLWIQDTLGVYFPLESRQEDSSGRCGMSCGITDLGMQGMCCHPCLQGSSGSIIGRVGHFDSPISRTVRFGLPGRPSAVPR